VPEAISKSPLAYDAVTSTWSRTGATINIPAMLIIAAVTALLVIGIQESARANAVIVVLKVSVVILFILFGWAYINPDNFAPFIPLPIAPLYSYTIRI